MTFVWCSLNCLGFTWKNLANVQCLWTRVAVFFHGTLRPQKPYGLLGTGKGGRVCVCGWGGGVGYLRVAHPITATRKDRRDRQPPSEQQCYFFFLPPSLVRSILLIAVSTAARSKVTKTVYENSCWGSTQDSPSCYESPAPPPSWSLLGSAG